MGQMYTVSFDNVAVTAVQDLFEITAPATCIVLLHALHLSQSTEVKDAEEEMLRLRIRSGQTTSGSGGNSATPVKQGGQLLAAAASAAEINNTTQASAGTIIVHELYDWNVRVPFDKIWTPETRLVISPSRRATVELIAAPADSVSMCGTLWFEEIG